MCPLPLWERAALHFSGLEWERGDSLKVTPLPSIVAELLRPPSPTRGEGTITQVAAMTHHGFSPAVSTNGRSGSMMFMPKMEASMKL